jgi:hypothetical protein
MDALITAAARALAAGDPLGALKRVALRDDARALALRGIAMAQLGDLVRAKALGSKYPRLGANVARQAVSANVDFMAHRRRLVAHHTNCHSLDFATRRACIARSVARHRAQRAGASAPAPGKLDHFGCRGIVTAYFRSRWPFDHQFARHSRLN